MFTGLRMWLHKRQQNRQLVNYVRSLPLINSIKSRGYDATKPSRLTASTVDGWSLDFNSLVAGSNPILRRRVRQLVRNFAPYRRAINAYSAFVVGKGARFQSLAEDAKGKSDPKLRRLIEDDFNRWMEKCDTTGKRHFYEGCQMVTRQRKQEGEFFAHKVFLKKKQNLALSFIHVDRVTGGLDIKPQVSDAIVFAGLEFSPLTGEPYGYHVLDEQYPGYYNYKTTRIPAQDMLHSFQWLEPGQLRGVTDFAPVIMLADDLVDYTQAELDGAKMAAKWLAFVTSPDPVGFQAARSPFGNKTADDKKKIERLENGIIEYLSTGEKIELATASGRPGDSFDRYTNWSLRMLSISQDLDYPILSGDYTGVNYSTARVQRNDQATLLFPHHFWLVHSFMNPVFHAWLQYNALTKDYLKGYWQNPLRFQKAMWIPAGQQSLDPLREGKAAIDLVRAGLASPQGVILAGGGDPELVMKERVRWKQLEDQFALDNDLDDVSTAMQSNPAKLGASETKEIDEEASLENVGGTTDA